MRQFSALRLHVLYDSEMFPVSSSSEVKLVAYIFVSFKPRSASRAMKTLSKVHGEDFLFLRYELPTSALYFVQFSFTMAGVRLFGRLLCFATVVLFRVARQLLPLIGESAPLLVILFSDSFFVKARAENVVHPKLFLGLRHSAPI